MIASLLLQQTRPMARLFLYITLHNGLSKAVVVL
jgi:hypothetical protein